MEKSREYAVCDFTVINTDLDEIYCNGETVKLKEPAVIEFAAVKFNDCKITEQFHTFVQIDGLDPASLTFEIEYPPFRGVTPSMLIGAPTEAEALRAFHTFINGTTLLLRNHWYTEPQKNLRKCAKRHGIKFDNPIIRIDDIVSAADVLMQYDDIGERDLMQIAANMRDPCEWKDIFIDNDIQFGREDCIGYALAFAELIIKLGKEVDLPF